jgi:hypothetical protein
LAYIPYKINVWWKYHTPPALTACKIRGRVRNRQITVGIADVPDSLLASAFDIRANAL